MEVVIKEEQSRVNTELQIQELTILGLPKNRMYTYSNSVTFIDVNAQ